jgi:hypothetical protein
VRLNDMALLAAAQVPGDDVPARAQMAATAMVRGQSGRPPYQQVDLAVLPSALPPVTAGTVDRGEGEA